MSASRRRPPQELDCFGNSPPPEPRPSRATRDPVEWLGAFERRRPVLVAALVGLAIGTALPVFANLQVGAGTPVLANVNGGAVAIALAGGVFAGLVRRSRLRREQDAADSRRRGI